MDAPFTEKDFFLRAFHGTTLVWVVTPAAWEAPGADWGTLALLLTTLRGAGVGVLLLHPPGPPPPGFPDGEGPGVARLALPDAPAEMLLTLWRGRRGVTLASLSSAEEGPFLAAAAALLTALRVSRLVVIHPEGGVGNHRGHAIGYLSARRLQGLLASDARLPRRGLLERVAAMLAGGVESVSLCRLEEVGDELFTYAGGGTFFSQHHYCHVRRLGLNHFSEVAAIIRRGEREGYLLPRGEEGLLAVLTSGYGAFIAEGNLAGVCGLLTDRYREQRAGEVVSLYTITRYLGEGVGGHLLRQLRRDARQRGLAYLFACTSSPRVVTFFQRHGYRLVPQEQLPPAKWEGYDPERRQRVSCLRLALPPLPAPRRRRGRRS